MARVVKPFECNRVVAPYDCSSPFQINDSELELFDSITKEHIERSGTKIEYYPLNIEKSKRDALYDEPSEMCWERAVHVIGHVTYPDADQEAREEGLRTTFDCELFVARAAFEEAHMKKPPEEGDVVRFWNYPFYNSYGVNHEKYNDKLIPRAGFYFDVVLCDPDAVVFDTGSFTGFKMRLRRRTEFTAERRLVAP